MRKITKLAFISSLILAISSSQGIFAQRVVEDSLVISGNLRHFKLFLPDNLPDKAPLVFALHGYGSSGPVNTWMNESAVKHKFAVCVPVGLKDSRGKRGWNVGYPSQEGWQLNDVETMVKMAKYVQKKYRLSKANTFLTGMSNGGEMCYLLSYKKQNVFKALASVAGLTLTWMYEEREKTRPRPFMEIHGTEDRTSEWTGDLENKYGWGKYMSVPDAVKHIVEKNKCTYVGNDTVKGKSFDKNGHVIVKHYYKNTKTHNDVLLYEVIGAGHNTFTADMNTGEEIWQFFSRYLKK